MEPWAVEFRMPMAFANIAVECLNQEVEIILISEHAESLEISFRLSYNVIKILIVESVDYRIISRNKIVFLFLFSYKLT